MLIEQIFKFELMGLTPCSKARPTCTPTTGYFHDQTKISLKENFCVDYYLVLKYCSRKCILLSPTCAKLFTKFDYKMQDFERV